MTSTNNAFLASSLPIGHSAVKNIIFRSATIVLHFVVYRFLSFIAFKTSDYASFLMFAEDAIQKTYFAIARGLNKQTILVLSFAVLTAAAGFYDTLLWSLDFPGYMTRMKTVSAAQLTTSMVQFPAYIIFLTNSVQEITQVNLGGVFGASLYTAGLNFTLPGVIRPATPSIVPPVALLSGSVSVSPRIWLDSEGFSVGVDNTIMLTSKMNSTNFCHLSKLDTNRQAWHCDIPNNDAFELIQGQMGMPVIWWDLPTSPDHSEYLRPERRDNPWKSLGAGGGTAVLKQVFSVTKGATKHTFLQTTFKATSVAYAPSLMQNSELTDFVRRTWGGIPGRTLTPDLETVTASVLGATNNESSITLGTFLQEPYSVASISAELFTQPTPESPMEPQTRLYTYFRFSSTNITLVRSEAIFTPLTSTSSCNAPHTIHSIGGVFRTDDCNVTPQNQTGLHLFGQIDTSSVVILNLLGDGSADTSAKALDETGLSWYNNNTHQIDRLLYSRALILSGNRADVQVAVYINEVAISGLQLLLVVLPFFLVLCVFSITFRQRMSYYKNSFLAAVVATTDLETKDCTTVGYIKSPPEIVLKASGNYTLLGIHQRGTIVARNDPPQLPYGTAYDSEPLLLDKEYP